MLGLLADLDLPIQQLVLMFTTILMMTNHSCNFVFYCIIMPTLRADLQKMVSIMYYHKQ